MTRDERLACDALLRSSRLESDADIHQYMQAARSLPITGDPETLGVLLDCLNSIDAGEVQYELIEAVERFSDEVYVRGVLPRARQLVDRAGNWGWMVLQTMLNTECCLDVAIRAFNELDSVAKEEFLAVLDTLCRRDPRYDDRRRMFIVR